MITYQEELQAALEEGEIIYSSGDKRFYGIAKPAEGVSILYTSLDGIKWHKMSQSSFLKFASQYKRFEFLTLIPDRRKEFRRTLEDHAIRNYDQTYGLNVDEIIQFLKKENEDLKQQLIAFEKREARLIEETKKGTYILQKVSFDMDDLLISQLSDFTKIEEVLEKAWVIERFPPDGSVYTFTVGSKPQDLPSINLHWEIVSYTNILAWK